MNQSKEEFNIGFENKNKIAFENIEEYKKAFNNMEAELLSKQYEISSINNALQECKKITEILQQECENLNNKNISLINEKSTLDKKYQTEIEKLESSYKNKINEYEMKIQKLSLQDLESMRTQIENDYKNKYEESIFIKDQEIIEKNHIIENLKNELILLEKSQKDELEFMKKDMDTLRNIHKSETDDLYNRIQILKRNNSSKNSDETYHFLNNELEKAKQQINFLNRENLRLKKDNESLLKEKNTLNINFVTLNNKLTFDEKKNGFEINRLKNNIENLKSENNSLKNDIQLKDKEIDNFFNEKMKLKNRISSKEMECLQLKNEINILNNIVKSHQESLNNNLISNYKDKKEMILEGKKMENRYKKEIDELNMKLRGTKNMDDLEDIINDKDEEINKLKNKIKQIENDVVDDLKYKYKDAIKKKQFYKSQCKEANQKIEKLYKKLTPEQQKEFQNIFNADNSNIINSNNFFEVSQSGFV